MNRLTIVLLLAMLPAARPCAAQPRLVDLDVMGTVDAVGPGGVRVIANDVTYLVAVTPQSHVSVKGTASRDFLAVGTPVAFTADLDDKGQPTGPAAEVSIFPSDPPGIHADGAIGDEQAARPAKRRPAGTYRVVGAIRGMAADGSFFVAAGKDRVPLSVTEDAKILVDSANIALARKGDAVTAVGKYQQPPNLAPGQPIPPLLAQAEELKIELATPLEYTGKKRPTKPKAEPKP